MLKYVPNVQVSDTTGDAQRTLSPAQKNMLATLLTCILFYK